MRFNNNNDGGGRKKEWMCLLKNGKPMYTNTRTGDAYSVFLNKNNRPTYRNKGNIALEAKDCSAEVITALRGRDEKTVLESMQNKKVVPPVIKKKTIKIILKPKSPKQKA